jgi:hypothetical protein
MADLFQGDRFIRKVVVLAVKTFGFFKVLQILQRNRSMIFIHSWRIEITASASQLHSALLVTILTDDMNLHAFFEHFSLIPIRYLAYRFIMC